MQAVQERSRSSLHRVALAFLSLLVTAVLLVPLPHHARAPWVAALLNFGHVALFALLAGGLWMAYPKRLAWVSVASAIVAGGFELLQGFVGRAADPRDFWWGLLGILLFATWAGALPISARLPRIALRIACSALLLAWPLGVTVTVLADSWAAHSDFPVICDFTSPWSEARWRSEGATLNRTRDGVPAGVFTGRIDVQPKNGAAGLVLFPIVRDWRSYRKAYCELSFEGPPLEILLSIRDGHRVKPPLKRFDLIETYPAGTHRIDIDLQALARGERFAPLKTSRVESFHLVVHTRDRRTLYLRRIWLE